MSYYPRDIREHRGLDEWLLSGPGGPLDDELDEAGGDVPPICDHPRCENAGQPYSRAGEGAEPDARLCCEHAAAAGFCWGCGEYCGGEDTFDSAGDGLCEFCAADIPDDDDDAGEAARD